MTNAGRHYGSPYQFHLTTLGVVNLSLRYFVMVTSSFDPRIRFPIVLVFGMRMCVLHMHSCVPIHRVSSISA